MKYQGIYLPLMFVAILLTCAGIVMVLNSTYNSTLIHSPTASYIKTVATQAGMGLVGILVMFVFSRVDYHIFLSFRTLVVEYLIAIVLLVLVFRGEGVRDSHRWVEVGGFTFQSSEFAKIIGVLYTAFFINKNKKWYTKLGTWISLFLPLGLMILLIYKEPDLSTTICFCVAICAILFVNETPWYVLTVCALGVVGIFLLKLFTGEGYHGDRFVSWLHAWDDPQDKGYQVIQSLYAIGDGGLFGVGIGNSKQKISHLPMSDTDYIFSIVCEEFGFIGALVLIGLYVAYMIFGIKIAMEAYDREGVCVATGLTMLVSFQAFVNMGVATNVMPSTGLTLPFISKGASSLLMTLASTGILLSISSYRTAKKKRRIRAE